MQEVLKKLRKINTLLQDEHSWTESGDSDLPFSALAEEMGSLLHADLFIASKDGRVLGAHDEFHVGNVRLMQYVDERQMPQFYMDELQLLTETVENIDVNAKISIFPIEQKDQYLESKTTIVPVFSSGQRLGYVILGRAVKPFDTNDLILAEYASTVIGVELLHWQNARFAQAARERQNVHLAFKTLSYSEFEALKVIFSGLNGLEYRFTAAKIADQHDITRSVIVHAIRKLESAGVIEGRSLGVKGTYIKIKNENILKAIREEFKK